MDSREAERRRGDRRRNDRRQPGGRRREDSLFEAVGDTSSAGTAAESFFDPGWLAAGDVPEDSRALVRQAQRASQARSSALVRVYRTYAAARAAVGVGLVGVQGIGNLIGARSSEWLALLSVLYAVQAITLWLLPRFGALAREPALSGRRHWLPTIGVDLLCFTLLYVLAAGATFNYAALLVLPVLMAGVLTARLFALGTASAVALMLLIVAWQLPQGADTPGQMLQAGLAGLGLFIITLLAGELAGRLAREEQAARGSLKLARQQAQLNRLVIEEMADGVLVVDRRLRVRAANPAARALLVNQGLSRPAPFSLHKVPAWKALQEAVTEALDRGDWPDGGRDVTLLFGEGHTRTLRLRVRFMRGRSLPVEATEADEAGGETRPAGDTESFAVLLLEDLRTLQARIRQEKLAAMGRVSAGIAHEIRNPLAAIAQANALLMEDELPPAQRLLARMVADNVERLKRLVDDVTEVAPGAEPAPRDLDVVAAVSQATAEWARTVQLPMGADSRLRVELPVAELAVSFDPEHLRRVLVNLLDNAHRHATAQPGAIVLRLAARDGGRVVLSVASDSEPIAAEIERHLFEPFFSTRSRGSGLGLYICRELCERYGASIEYVARAGTGRHRNEFVVSLRRAPRISEPSTLPLETG